MSKAPSLEPETNPSRTTSSTVHVYKPYKAGFPPLGPYFHEIWRRREFLMEMSRTKVRVGHMGTVLGKAWNILNPLLMGVVYFLLVTILRGGRQGPDFFVYLIAGMFLFKTLQSALTSGSTSVTSAGSMLTSTSIPTALFPLATIATAIRKFIPTVFVLVILAAVVKIYPKPAWIAAAGMALLLIILSTGLAMLFATLQVYFRDTKEFLSYVSRIWLYCSPVLWTAAQLPHVLEPMQWINPAYQIVAGWSMAIVYGEWPTLSMWLLASAWSFGMLILGFVVFVTRERDFAVRI